jgi:hypothetical protein
MNGKHLTLYSVIRSVDTDSLVVSFTSIYTDEYGDKHEFQASLDSATDPRDFHISLEGELEWCDGEIANFKEIKDCL